MKQRQLRLLLALCLLQPGCSFFCYGLHNLVEAPVDARDDYLMQCRFKQMAEDSWKCAVLADPSHPYSYHYGRGYVAGYVDYLDANGTGEPPAAPPWIYRTAAFETPDGQRAAEDWFAGFRHGAAAARASGYRDATVVVPMALPPSHWSAKPAPAAQAAPESSQKPTELLPAPRKAAEKKDDEKTPLPQGANIDEPRPAGSGQSSVAP